MNNKLFKEQAMTFLPNYDVKTEYEHKTDHIDKYWSIEILNWSALRAHPPRLELWIRYDTRLDYTIKKKDQRKPFLLLCEKDMNNEWKISPVYRW
jgi:hypothetical protein